MTTLRSLLIVPAIVMISSLAFAEAVSAPIAEKTVKDTVDQVKAIVAKDKSSLSEIELDKKIEKILLPKFDFEMMARSCLGANWKKATPAEQEEFVRLFTTLLSKSYLAKIRKNIETATVTLLPSAIKEDRVVVRSRVKSDDQEIGVDYRIYTKAGEYLVYDVLVENVGLVSNYRSEFSSILDSGNFEKLLAKLRTQTAKFDEK